MEIVVVVELDLLEYYALPLLACHLSTIKTFFFVCNARNRVCEAKLQVLCSFHYYSELWQVRYFSWVPDGVTYSRANVCLLYLED